MKNILFICLLLSCFIAKAQNIDPYSADNSAPKQVQGMKLLWNDEFNSNGLPNPANWKFEKGFVRNEELQWYQEANANCENGLLVFNALKANLPNPNYVAGSTNWRTNREFINYTASSIQTAGLFSFLYGRVEVRARIDTSKGAWPAIWTLGENGEWPACGEIDMMEFYRISGVQNILANMAWGTNKRWTAKWDGSHTPLSHFLDKDKDWPKKFHVWRMDWTKDKISLYLDDELLNETDVNATINPVGPPTNGFQQKQYLLLNLAIGGNGGDPSKSTFPIKYEVDYVRVYQPVETGVNQKNDQGFLLSPNPAGDFLNIRLNDEKSTGEVSIYALTGEKLVSEKITKQTENITISALENGIYFVKVKLGETGFVKKFVKI